MTTEAEEKIAIQRLIDRHTPKQLAALWSSVHRNGALYVSGFAVIVLICIAHVTLSVCHWSGAHASPSLLGPEVRDLLIDFAIVVTSLALIKVRITSMRQERRRIDAAITLQREQQHAAMQMH